MGVTEIRLECLRMALKRGGSEKDVKQAAKNMSDFVLSAATMSDSRFLELVSTTLICHGVSEHDDGVVRLRQLSRILADKGRNIDQLA